MASRGTWWGNLYWSHYGTRVGTFLEFRNSEETCPGLGVPLPEGEFRVFRRHNDGEVEFVQEDMIGHTAKDEIVRLQTGYAADVVVERVQAAERRQGKEKWNEQDWTITLRNHEDKPVEIEVKESLRSFAPMHAKEMPMFGGMGGERRNCHWRVLSHSHDYEKEGAHTLRFVVPIAANAEEALSYSVRCTW